MTGTRKIAAVLFIAVLGLFAALNWWKYLNAGGETLIPVKPVSSSKATDVPRQNSLPVASAQGMAGAAVPSGASGTQQTDFDPDPPKRPPLIGDLLYDPFYRDKIKTSKAMKSGSQSMSKALLKREEPVPSYTLEMVLVDGERRLALVNGRLYEVGDRVGTMTIIRIRPREVILRDGSENERVLRLSPDKT